MGKTLPSLSTDQVAAFVELARAGSLRNAADGLLITEQGVRNRLLALEERLGVELYRKARGTRRSTPLTPAGQKFLPHAIAFLERAEDLRELFASEPRRRELHVVATQYLILYHLIDAAKRFRAAHPHVQIRLESRTEREVEECLLNHPEVAFGVAAPYEPSADLEYRELFPLDWSFIAPFNHRLFKRKPLRLTDLADEPLILLERGSTGRQHVVNAFHEANVSPTVAVETTNTEIIVRMVEAGLGVSIVPLMPDGSVLNGRKVAARAMPGIRPIRSGVLYRKGETLSGPAELFMQFLKAR